MDEEERTRIVSCRACQRNVVIPDPPQGHPYGWYHVTVTVPPWFNGGSGKAYRWIGLFCCAQCLADGLDRIREGEELMKHAYAHE